MKRYGTLIFLLLLLFLVRAGAQVSYLPEDEEVLRLKHLFMESGFLFPTASFPLAKRDLADFAEALSRSANDDDVSRSVQEYLDQLGFQADSISIGAKGSLTYEHYFRTREVWEDFHRLFLQQSPILDLSLFYAQDGHACLFIDSVLQRKYTGFSDNNLLYPEGDRPIVFEWQALPKGFLTYSLGPLELEFGRNQLHYGPGRFSSLLPSQRLPFVDAFRYRLRLGPLEMNSFIASLENRGASEDVPLTGDFEFVDNTILSTMHRFEFAFKKLSLGITGLSFLARERNGFLLGDFFPVFSWHNANVGCHNLSVIGELRIVPFAGLEIFGQCGFDDINAGIVGFPDSEIPTISAYILGLDYFRRTGKGLFAAYLETGHTHYLWGNFWEHHALERAIYRYYTINGVQTLPMTSAFGPGAYWVHVELSLEFLFNLTAKTFFTFVSQNSQANLITTPYESAELVAAAPSIHTIHAGFDFSFDFRKFTTLHSRPALVYREPELGFECTLGISLKAEGTARIQ